MGANETSRKKRILCILFGASVGSSLMTGASLVFMLERMEIFGDADLFWPIIFAMVVCFGSCFFIFLLLYQMLDRNVVMAVSERETMDIERDALNEQLRHAQKMEAVGRLAGSIAHDFNNLLTIIDGYSSLIIADPKSEETEEHAKEVVEAARKASFITRKLLGFSQKEKNEPISLDLNKALSDADGMLTRLIGEKITLITKPCATSIHAKADPVQMGQVLMNLVVNARDAMPSGGRIRVEIEREVVTRETNALPSALPEGAYAAIRVIDTGTGMDEPTLAKIFEPFFTTKEEGKGSGLGLSIVKSIMKENKGFIEVTSRIDAGSTFTIYLPEVEREIRGNQASYPLGDAGHVADQSESGKKGARTVLLVEDDPMIRKLMERALAQRDYNVITAEEGWEGVKIARNHGGRIDLLFTDVVMPGLGGAELAAATRELHPELKVLFMSGYSRSQLIEEGVPEHSAVLEKPFTPEKALLAVDRLLA